MFLVLVLVVIGDTRLMMSFQENDFSLHAESHIQECDSIPFDSLHAWPYKVSFFLQPASRVIKKIDRNKKPCLSQTCSHDDEAFFTPWLACNTTLLKQIHCQVVLLSLVCLWQCFCWGSSLFIIFRMSSWCNNHRIKQVKRRNNKRGSSRAKEDKEGLNWLTTWVDQVITFREAN